MDKMYHFFICSTFQDLLTERSSAISIIQNFRQLPVALEMLPVADSPVSELAKHYIDLSEFFVIIIGERFSSFVEAEYDYAKASNKLILVFIKDINNRTDDLSIFTQKLLNNHLCNYWSDGNTFTNVFTCSIATVLSKITPPTYWTRTSTLFENPNNDSILKRYIDSYADISNIDILALMYKDIEELNEFYKLTKTQAKRAFWLSVSMCIAGFFLFSASAFCSISAQRIEFALLNAFGGVIIELIAGTALYVYNKTLQQLNYYHDILHNNERFMSLIHIAGKTNCKDKLIEKIIDSELTCFIIRASHSSQDSSPPDKA